MIVASEPKNADDTAQSFAAGRIVKPTSPPKTVADALKYVSACHKERGMCYQCVCVCVCVCLPLSLRVTVGNLAWPILRDNLTGVVTVTEEEIISTTKIVSF